MDYAKNNEIKQLLLSEIHHRHVVKKTIMLSMMDEDYFREDGILNRRNPIDIVFQSEYIMERISNYV